MDFSNTYIDLGQRFYEKSLPTPVAQPSLLLWNKQLATQLKITTALEKDDEMLAAIFAGNRLLEGTEPISCAYAGHQFGSFNPQLGDGRAHLLGEIIDDQGKRRDLQLKGSGQSRFSRGGDGRCAIGPALREFIMSEAMLALGVPTTQCLAVVASGEPVYREKALPGAIVSRVASSHIRVGTFQYFAAQNDIESLQALSDYSIDRHFPNVRKLPGDPIVNFLDAVIRKQIKLICEWLRVGFIHGVMNTDNTSICGETIDYGPCAMINAYDPATVFSSIDKRGRYSFGNQPHIANWNMARFAESLLPLFSNNSEDIKKQFIELIQDFPARFQHAYQTMMAQKLGFVKKHDKDSSLVAQILTRMEEQKLDYTLTFHSLSQSLSDQSKDAALQTQLGSAFTLWRERIKLQSAKDGEVQALMQSVNPVVIPRNHHIEAVLASCEMNNDMREAKRILTVLRNPYEQSEATKRYQVPPEDNDIGYRTFCGT